MADHGLKGAIRVKQSECFKMGKDVYVPFCRISFIFNKRGNKSIKEFDKDNFIIHPTKGKLFLYPGKVVILKNGETQTKIFPE